MLKIILRLQHPQARASLFTSYMIALSDTSVQFHVRNTKALREASRALVPGAPTTTAFWWFKGYRTFCTSQLKQPKSHAKQRGHNLSLNHQICTERHLWLRDSPMDKNLLRAAKTSAYVQWPGIQFAWMALTKCMHMLDDIGSCISFDKNVLWAMGPVSISTMCQSCFQKTRGIHRTSPCDSTWSHV